MKGGKACSGDFVKTTATNPKLKPTPPTLTSLGRPSFPSAHGFFKQWLTGWTCHGSLRGCQSPCLPLKRNSSQMHPTRVGAHTGAPCQQQASGPKSSPPVTSTSWNWKQSSWHFTSFFHQPEDDMFFWASPPPPPPLLLPKVNVGLQLDVQRFICFKLSTMISNSVWLKISLNAIFWYQFWMTLTFIQGYTFPEVKSSILILWQISQSIWMKLSILPQAVALF